jgi:crotonobetainyl-CoA:carnitine CoA-transferase CaiB-like acyl-CoA transferase
MGGLMSITGDPAGEPQKVGVALVDVLAGLFASVGILAALRHRDRTGCGQRVDTNLMSVLLASLANQAASFTVAGEVPRRLGNAHPSIAPYEPLPCADRELIVAVGTDRQFASLCEVLGVPELATDPRYVTNEARVGHRQELRADLERPLAAREASEWARRLGDARVPAGVVNDLAEAFSLADSLGLAPIAQIAREGTAPIGLPANPLKLSTTPPSYRAAPPPMPEHGRAGETHWLES